MPTIFSTWMANDFAHLTIKQLVSPTSCTGVLEPLHWSGT